MPRWFQCGFLHDDGNDIQGTKKNGLGKTGYITNEYLESVARGAAKGDASKFRELVILTCRQVWSLAMNLTGCQDEADEVGQEVYAKVYRGLGRFNFQAKVSTWIHTITLNVVRDRKRSSKRYKSTVLIEDLSLGERHLLEEAGSSPNDNPEQSVSTKQVSSVVRRILGELPEIHREVLVLRDVHGFSGDEVAQIVGLPVGTVDSRLHRARAAFRHKAIRFADELDWVL